MWREILGAWEIISKHKKGYANHPAVKEFELCPGALYDRLQFVREEMLARGYHPKEFYIENENKLIRCWPKEWQTLEEQIEILKSKGCKCKV